MAETERVSIGFSGGQVVEIRVSSAQLRELRKALEKPEGWTDLASEGGAVSLNLSEIVFLRSTVAHQGIGFGG
jgi:hypothetical protein